MGQGAKVEKWNSGLAKILNSIVNTQIKQSRDKNISLVNISLVLGVRLGSLISALRFPLIYALTVVQCCNQFKETTID